MFRKPMSINVLYHLYTNGLCNLGLLLFAKEKDLVKNNLGCNSLANSSVDLLFRLSDEKSVELIYK